MLEFLFRRIRAAWLVAGSLALVAPTVLAADVNGPFGLWPNCIAPAIPIEVHSWFGETGEEVPRHMHLAACLPNARDLDGSLVSVSRPQRFTVRLTAFNNPGVFNLARWSWESNVKENVPLNYKCQSNPMELKECHWWVDMTLDPDKSPSGGLHELRLTPNISRNDLGNRQFATLNYQIYLRNGRPASNYRSRVDPIGRSWYTGFDYANVSVNYMDFFDGAQDLNKSIPTVSGVVPLQIQHAKGIRNVRSHLWLDPDFHHHPEDWPQAVAGVPRPSGAVLLYDRAGRYEGTYNWDTRGLANGVHVLYFETVDTGPTGFNAGALKLFFDVQNGAGSARPPAPQPPAPTDPPPPPTTNPPANPTPPPVDPIHDALEDIDATTNQALAGQRDAREALRLVYERARAALGL